MLIYYIVIFSLCLCDVLGDKNTAGSNSSASCTTPDNQLGEGICMNIRNCSSLLKILLERGHEDAPATYLRRSQCGMEKKLPKVCCPTKEINKVVFPSEENKNVSSCGKTDRKAHRIVLREAASGDWPWVVALGYKIATNPELQFRCSASLISNKWVLTAAHCVKNIGNLTLTTARIGDVNLDAKVDDKATPIDVPVEEIIPHPDFSLNPVTNDIALIRLKNPVTFTKLIRAICIANKPEHKKDEFYATKKFAFTVGWGTTDWREPTSNSLQEARVEIIDNEKCAQNFTNQKSAMIDQRVVCVGITRDFCLSDSGGPLMLPSSSDHSYYLVGIASFGIRCESGYPGVYTRVVQFSDWINRVTGI